jgi:HEAT repeat protein
MKKPDLVRKLSGGDRRSIGKSEDVVSEVLADARLFDALVDCMLVEDPLVRMRAADAVEKITLMRPDFLKKHKTKLMARAAKIDQKEVRWHVAQLLPRLELNSTERKTVQTILQSYLTDGSSIVRTFAMQALADLAMQDASLRPGIMKQLERLTKEGTPAMQSRGRKLLAELSRGNER